MAERLSHNSREIKIAIRCDATAETGFGHFSRSFQLALFLKELHATVTFYGEYNAFALEMLASAKISSVETSGFETLLFDPEEILILDSYLFDQPYLNRALERQKAVVLIDDFNRLKTNEVDLVFNPSIAAQERFAYAAEKVLLGTHYIPFKKEYAAIREQKQVDEIKSILLFVGGSDLHHIGPDLLRLIDNNVSGKQCVYISNNASDFPECKNSWKSMKPTQKLEKVLSKTDLLICGGGFVKYEAAFCKIPVISVNQTFDQWEESTFVEKHGLLLNCGIGNKFDEQEFVAALKKVQTTDYLKRFRQHTEKKFSTNSGNQLAKAILALAK